MQWIVAFVLALSVVSSSVAGQQDCEYIKNTTFQHLPPQRTVNASIAFVGGNLVEISYDHFAGAGFGYLGSLGYRITPLTNYQSFINPTTEGSSLNQLVASKGWETVWKSLPKTGFQPGLVNNFLPLPVENGGVLDFDFGTYSPPSAEETVFVLDACRVRRSRKYQISELMHMVNPRTSERVFTKSTTPSGFQLTGTLYVAGGYPNFGQERNYGWTLPANLEMALTINAKLTQREVIHPTFFRVYPQDQRTDAGGCLVTHGFIANDGTGDAYLLPETCHVVNYTVPLDFTVTATPGEAKWVWDGLSTVCNGNYDGEIEFACDTCKRGVGTPAECPAGELTPDVGFVIGIDTLDDNSNANQERIVIEGSLWQGTSRGREYFKFPMVTAFGNALQMSAAWRLVNYDREVYTARFTHLRLYRPTRPGQLPTEIQLVPPTDLGAAYHFTPFTPDQMKQYLDIANASPDVFIGFWMDTRYLAENGFGVWTLEADIEVIVDVEKAKKRAALGIAASKEEKECTNGCALPKVRKQFGVWESTFKPACENFGFSKLCVYNSGCDWDWDEELCYKVKEPSLRVNRRR